MRKIILTTFITAGLSSVFSQNSKIDWQPMVKSTGRVADVLPLSGKDFYTLRYSGGLLFGSRKIAQHQDFDVTATGKIEIKVEGSIATFMGARVVDGKLMIFMSDRKENKNHLFIQEYGKDLLPKGPAIELANYTFEKGKYKGYFNIINSRDNNTFGIIWSQPGKKENNDAYGFKIFDSNLTTISEGEYTLPFEGNLSTINQYHLSNTGDFFINITEYEREEKDKKLIRRLNFKALHILQITADDLEEFTVDLKGKRVEAMDMRSDNEGLLVCSGIYGENNQSGVAGLFYFRMDFNNKEVLDEGFEKFGKEFITQGWNERQKERADKKEARGKGEPTLYNYIMQDTEILKDGSVIGSIEQYFVVTTTDVDPRTGATRTTNTYYYNDIIAFNVGVDGKFKWLSKIPKHQVSTNDGGPFSSYSRYIDSGKLCFIFNDNIKNYNESGNYQVDGRPWPANFGKKKNAVALTQIDLESGEIKRNTFFDRTEITAIAVPKLFQIDHKTNELLLYAIYGKKERFGLLSFNDEN